MMRIAVCVATYRRPDGLRRLILGLDGLIFSGEAPDVEIIVVDNDDTGSAGTVCDEVRPHCRWPLTCVVEQQRGIPFARNRALDSARDGFDFLAFLDDDEVPEPGWLEELLSIRRQYEADVVAGPVLPLFEHAPPLWVLKGKFFDRRRYDTGSSLTHAFTNNVLLRSSLYVEGDLRFDERLALTGGTDRLFFRQATLGGFKIVWADDAVVHEWNPPSRVCFRWLVQRAFRVGNTMTLTERYVRPSWSTYLVLAAKGTVWVGLGLLLAPLGLVAGRHVIVRGIRFMAYGAGMLLGLIGRRYEEYRKTHGA